MLFAAYFLARAGWRIKRSGYDKTLAARAAPLRDERRGGGGFPLK